MKPTEIIDMDSPQLVALREETLGDLPAKVSVPGYDRRHASAGIVHIGVGNFHRAHEALFVDRCLHLPGQEGWGIIGVGLREGEVEKARAFQAQKGLYTLTENSPDGASQTRVIGALLDYLYAPAQREAVLEALTRPSIRIVSLTITEGGYNLDESTGEFVLTNPAVQQDLKFPERPTTAFGYITEALARRRAAGTGGFTVLSCDNLRSNGAVARKAVTSFARARDKKLAAWIDEAVSFPNSMVDRIAPTIGAEEKRRLRERTGIDDAVPVVCESFLQWVLEDKFSAGRPAFDRVGVELRDDVERFEAIKGRLLNAAHTMLSYPALMCGYTLVDEALRDPAMAAFLGTFMEEDVIPLLEGPQGMSLHGYKNQVLERFANPATGDRVLRLAHNGIAKLPVFFSRTLSDLVARGGPFERVAHNLACFERYLEGRGCGGEKIAVDEPHLTERDRALLASDDPLALLKLSPFENLRLFADRSFVEAFFGARARLASDGPHAALRFAANLRPGQDTTRLGVVQSCAT
jgi:mannitol-1-phosphate/altronate dehydrogenase